MFEGSYGKLSHSDGSDRHGYRHIGVVKGETQTCGFTVCLKMKYESSE